MLQLGIYINMLIDDYLRIKCHTCHKKIKFSDFFIIQKKIIIVPKNVMNLFKVI